MKKKGSLLCESDDNEKRVSSAALALGLSQGVIASLLRCCAVVADCEWWYSAVLVAKNTMNR